MSSTTTTVDESNTVAATAAATSAASGMNVKAKRPVLQTPDSACYPSEIRTPLSATPLELKRHDSFKSPISPPSSYMDFLERAKSKGGMMSPPSTCGSLSRFPSTDSVKDQSTSFASQDGAEVQTGDDNSTTPKQHPPITRNASTDSSASSWTCSSNETAPSPPAVAGPSRRKVQSANITIDTDYARFARPNSARTPHAMRIPHSPFSANSVKSPMSARSVQSPYATSAHPHTPWSASAPSPRVPFSPRNTALPPSVISAMEKRQACRIIKRENYKSSVETTYEVIPIDPAPRGKRRKTVGSEERLQTTPTQESHDAENISKSEEAIKNEKIDMEDARQA
ncbi:Hypothetical protein D9617_5g067990 [Elsinoe fawcettii]|nr:Hypothetical protein D9617_5g067990 [Elsinoe fawcettii]